MRRTLAIMIKASALIDWVLPSNAVRDHSEP